jgi:hypothetical protein
VSYQEKNGADEGDYAASASQSCETLAEAPRPEMENNPNRLPLAFF